MNQTLDERESYLSMGWILKTQDGVCGSYLDVSQRTAEREMHYLTDFGPWVSDYSI
jgi:hypothetical protein